MTWLCSRPYGNEPSVRSPRGPVVTTLEPRRRGRGTSAAVLVGALVLMVSAAATAASRPTSRLASLYDDWRDSIEPIAAGDELVVFDRLACDTERERFMAAFWEARGEEALRRFRDNELVVEELGSRSRERERVALLWGLPDRMETYPSCRSSLRRVEVWSYSSWNVLRQTGRTGRGFFVVFVQASNFDPRTARLFSPAGSIGSTAFWRRGRGERTQPGPKRAARWMSAGRAGVAPRVGSESGQGLL